MANLAALNNPTLIRAAGSIAVPLPFLLAGYSLSFSQSTVPVIYEQPAEVSTPAFKQIFYNGLYLVGPGAVLNTVVAGYLAYILPPQRTLWATSAVASFLLGPWTEFVMGPGIKKLIAISENKGMQAKATANLEHRQLMGRWVRQNFVRSVLLMIAGAASVRATLL